MKTKRDSFFEEPAHQVSMQDAHLTRAMAFMVKGLYYYNQGGLECINSDAQIADRLLKMYLHENTDGW